MYVRGRIHMKLFDEIVNKEELHPNFINIKRDPYKVAVLEGWADEDLMIRDGNNKFIKEFQKTFNSSLWELYCCQVLKKIGSKFNLQYNFPDFVFELLGEQMLIECTIANHADGMPPECDRESRLKNLDIDDAVYEQTIRLSNAFNGKYEKYIKKYVNHTWVDNKPYIIAIEPFEQPNFMITGNEAVRLLLFGWRFLRKTREEEAVSGIYKNENTVLPLGLFKSKKYEDISAVLFSNVATDGKIQAMSENPNCTFGQIRYNLEYDRPLAQFDSRMKYKKNDPRCTVIKKAAKFPSELYKQFTIRRPMLKWETDYKEDICDGLILYTNPYAKKPIKNEILEKMFISGINIVEYDLENDIEKSKINDHSLVQRIVFSMN